MFVVTLPQQAMHDPAAFAQKAKGAGVDLMEIRGDLTPDIPAFISPLPLVVSPRGSQSLLQRFVPEYVDVDIKEALPGSSIKIIRSYHNFESTPPINDLLKISTQLAEGSNVIKIATLIRSYADLVTLDELHKALPVEQKRVILGMGIKAHVSRLLSSLKNELTYTYLEEGQASAPGQIPLHLHMLTAHCKHPKIFGLLADLNTKSLSPLIHNTLFARNRIDALYALFPTDELNDAYNYLAAKAVSGFSVTAPFKQVIITKLDRIDGDAEELGTVNTVVQEGTDYVGYATDAYGLIEGYPFLKHARSAAILGSGGVVPSVIRACTSSGINDIRIFARNESMAKKLSSKFSISYDTLSNASSVTPDVLINTISENIPVRLSQAKTNAHAIDLRYGSSTIFQTEAKRAGYAFHDGHAMLLHQAIAQFRLFTGKEPSNESLQEISSLLLHHGKQ